MRSSKITQLLLCQAMFAVGAVAYAQDGVASAAPVTPAVEQVSGSSVRIVRLSEVRGVVRMDRNTGRGYEAAFANIPVVAGAGLRTGDGVAEVEFEDNSSLRLGPGSEIRFPRLSRTVAGNTVTTVEVVKGLVYVSLEKTKGNMFALREGAAETTLGPGAHVRLDARDAEATLAVFDGEAVLSMGGASTTVTKHETVDVNPAARTVSAVVHGTEEQDTDAWDKQGQQYHKTKASFAGTGGFGLYGANDLNYYGSFSDVAGCGSVWRPYFANAAWDPFGAGMWAYYPGAGYSWVSPYPWGWLPFHSGTWTSCGAGGWGWQPGGAWYGLNNVAMMRIPKRPVGHPLPTPPARNAGTLVPVNMRGAAFSGVTSGDRFVFRQNSAGLGVPREEYGNLRGTATHVERHGAATSGVSMNSMAVATSMRSRAEMGGTRAMGTVGAGRSSGTGTAASFNHASSAGNMGGMHGGSVSMPSSSAGSSAPAGSSAHR